LALHADSSVACTRSPGIRRLIPLAILALASSLPLTGLCADATNGPAAANATPTAQALLSGATTAARDFNVTTAFHLTQNTIQVDTLLDRSATSSTFILDSGAPMTIAASLVQALDLSSLTSIQLAGPEGGHSEVPVVRIPEITVAGLVFRDVGAVVDWVQPPDGLACLSTAGLMGASLLQTAIWQIDFDSQHITMTDSLSSLGSLQGAIRIPFTRSDAAGSPRIAVGVSDIDNVSLLVDLGFNGSIAIPTSLLAKAGDRVADTAPTEIGQASTTVFGHSASEVHIAQLRELRLGSLRLSDFPVITGPSVSDFHVGIDFLRHFRVTLDWQNDALYLEPREPISSLYDNFATYGFAPQLHEGRLIVGALWQGGAAQQAGLALGDRIVSVDDRDTAAPSFESVCALLDDVALYGSKTAPISVTRLRDGVEETVIVARTPLLTNRLPAEDK
tara:strand:- start:16083 stop:17426 length:1344 start_codon:yes stop_codon:yes gene_type:complete